MACPYTYLIGWTAQDKWYYGVRYAKSCDPSDIWVKYFTSSRAVSEFRALYGEPDVVEVRRCFDSTAAALTWEDRVLRRMDAVRCNRWINMANGGKQFLLLVRTAEHSAKIGAKRVGVKHTDEARAKMSAAASARRRGTPSEETRNKMRTAQIGRAGNHTITDSTRSKLSSASKLAWADPDYKASMQVERRARRHTEETRMKMSESAKLRWTRTQNGG